MGKLKKIKTPLHNDPLLAYETGVHIGDGTLGHYKNKHDYRIAYYGNLLTDCEFFAKILPVIIYKLYGLKPSIIKRPDRTSIELSIRSKMLFEFKRDLGLPIGDKTLMLNLPKKIISVGEDSIRNIIAGLFDTDGCFKVTKQSGKPYPKITIANKSSILADVKYLLQEREIGCNLCKDKQTGVNKLDINGKKNTDLFFKIIPSRNIKHLNRYKNWKLNGPLA